MGVFATNVLRALLSSVIRGVHVRTPRLLVAGLAIALVISAASLGLLRATPVAASTSTLAVVGNHLVDNGNTVVLRGVNRSGSEYACYQGFGFFDGPSDDASIAAIAAWGVNAVRVPLNEDCWLGINGVPAAYAGANYQAAITGFVTRLRAHGLYVILDNQFAGPGTTLSNSILPMPDADHAPTFWTQVATSFASDKGVIFDLYNEAHPSTWSCWADGCLVNGYQAVGMKSLTATVRATGATNVILIGGLSYNYDISQWLVYRPNDGQLIAGIHNYGYPGWDTPAIWDSIYAPTALQVPVTFGEMGFDGYVEKVMPWADAHGIGYLAWTWDTWGNNQALISDYAGTPTTYGLNFKNYLAGLTPAPTVSSVAPNNGLTTGGTPVTITGTNLTGATAVHFGATAASVFAVVNATTITATSPAGSGGVDVTVITTGGTSAITAGDRFTYGTPLAPAGLSAVAGDGEATLTWTPSSSVAPITGYTVVASPGGATMTVSAVVPAATVTGLTNGTAYTFTVAATNAIGTGPASPASSAVTPTAVAQGPSVAVLPAMSSGAYGGYLTAAYLQNVSGSAAHVRVQYFDQTGHGVGNGNSVAGLPAGATWTLRTDNGDSLAATQAGSAVVYSDQPLAVFVNEFAPGNSSDATSYTAIGVPAGTGNTLYAPAIANNAYGGYTTGIGLVSLATGPTNITVAYHDSSGTVIKTQTLPNIAAGAYQGLYSGDTALGLPNGFAGTATIASSAGALAAVVNETGPGSQFSSYDAVPSGSATLYAPTALSNAYGGYNTGMAIQNTTGTAGTVTIDYFDASGTATTTSHPLAANGYVSVYQGTDILVAGEYTARITSTVAIAAIVNEVAPSSTSAKQSTAYNTVAAGSSNLHLPLVESAGADGWSTGEGIMNTGAAPTTVTVTYYDPVSGAQVGTPQSLSLQPNAFWGLYQPTGGLPNGTRASAVVTTASGGQVSVICNESSSTSFMSYIGQ